VPIAKLTVLGNGEPSSVIQERVEATRAIQHARVVHLGKLQVLVNGNIDR
jgi:hypothetical protein